MKTPFDIRLIAIDLDGTLLNDEKNISQEDMQTLRYLGDKGILRIASTGRTIFKVKEVLANHVPFDYIVFSSGSGLYDWKEQQILMSKNINAPTAFDLEKTLIKENVNFVVFDSIPNNNKFRFHKGAGNCHEFDSYISRHLDNSKPLDSDENKASEVGQFMCIMPNNEEIFNNLKTKLVTKHPEIKVIRATSPVDDNFIWMEIFIQGVSKGEGINWICKKHKIEPSETIAIGNDYNDIDMLEFCGEGWLVANAPESLKLQFKTLDVDNNHSGLSRLTEIISI